jgi:hypothetical protein
LGDVRVDDGAPGCAANSLALTCGSRGQEIV